jgi:hypothetical protein
MSIQIKDAHKSFGRLEVVKGVSMTVEKGEVVSIYRRLRIRQVDAANVYQRAGTH